MSHRLSDATSGADQSRWATSASTLRIAIVFPFAHVQRQHFSCNPGGSLNHPPFSSHSALLVLIASCAVPWQLATAETPSLVRRTLDDTRLFATAPLRWDATDWSRFGSAVALITVSHEFDGRVRDHFAPQAGVVLDGKDRHSTRDALPAAAIVAATLVYANVIGDSNGYAEGWSMLEAAGLGTIGSYALKFAAGRERPNESRGVDSWRNGGDSFPSLHATAAFAIGTVFAESGNDSWRWVRRGVGYGVALGTAYRRLDGNVHWLSDTVAGAAIGVATANFVLNRRGHTRLSGKFSVVPLQGGGLVSWSMPLH